MDEKYIVAIDFGTHKVALAVAMTDETGTRVVYYKETPANGMKGSRILTERKVSQQLNLAIKDAEDILKIKIVGAVVGMPRFFIRTEENEAHIDDRDTDSYITVSEINDLKDFAQDSYPLEDSEQNTETVYGAVAQSFSTDEEFQLTEEDIVGMYGRRLEGHFKIFIGQKSPLTRIDRVMHLSGIVPIKKYFLPQITGPSVLYSTEAENGVALIDFGAGCTSVSIYYKNVLRHYASIPFGGGNVTKDIQTESNISLGMSENLKLAYGACMPEKLQNMSEKQLLIKSDNGDRDKRLSVKYLSEIITAREEEIIRAMLYEIGRSGFADKLQSGVVITGGGAMMTNIANFITEISGYSVRLGRPRMNGIFNACTGSTATSATAAVGLIRAAVTDSVINCACLAEDYKPAEEAAEESHEPVPTELEHQAGVLPGLMTEEEIIRRKEEEEQKKKKEERKPNVVFSWGNRFRKKVSDSCDNILNLLNENN